MQQLHFQGAALSVIIIINSIKIAPHPPKRTKGELELDERQFHAAEFACSLLVLPWELAC